MPIFYTSHGGVVTNAERVLSSDYLVKLSSHELLKLCRNCL